MLAAYLCRLAAKQAVPTSKQNRDEAVERLNLQERPREQQDAALIKDTPYTTGKILRAMTFLFPEFIGAVLFLTFGSDWISSGRELLRNGSMARLHQNPRWTGFGPLAESGGNDDDVLATLWRLFRHIVEQDLVQTKWLSEWERAGVRSRFNHSPATRKAIIDGLKGFDTYVRNTPYTRAWAKGFNNAQGVFSYVRGALSKASSAA